VTPTGASVDSSRPTQPEPEVPKDRATKVDYRCECSAIEGFGKPSWWSAHTKLTKIVTGVMHACNVYFFVIDPLTISLYTRVFALGALLASRTCRHRKYDRTMISDSMMQSV